MKTRVKFSKQILSILLCLAMLLSYVPMTAHAAYDYDDATKLSFRIIDLEMEYQGVKTFWGEGGSAFYEESLTKLADGKFRYTFEAALSSGGGTWWSDLHSITFDGVNCEEEYLRTFNFTDSTHVGGSTMTWTYKVQVSKYKGHVYGSWSGSDDGNHSRTCNVCGYVDTAEHSWVDATCVKAKYCEKCGFEDGEPAADAHSWGSYTTNNDGTHTKVCAYNGGHKDTQDCTYSDATCTQLAKCSVCGYTTGDYAKDVHSSDKFEYKQASADKHEKYYACCAESIGLEGHNYNAQTGKCTSCGYECLHNVFTDSVCDVCGYRCSHTMVGDRCSICGKQGILYLHREWDDSEHKLIEYAGIAPANFAVVTSSTTSMSNGWYVVYGDVTVSSRISIGGTVHLILADGSTLNARKGIEVLRGNTLCVYGQSESAGAGRLIATGGDNNSGIGSTKTYNDTGTIVINGGVITATGGQYAAGIGGISTAVVTINGGNVTATGGKSAAGIGGSNSSLSDGVTISINGGTVSAMCGSAGSPGIGSGVSAKIGHTGTFTLTGGNVKVTNGSNCRSSVIAKPKDINGNGLTLAVLTLYDASSNTRVTDIRGASYGISGVTTLDTDKLYFYLPSGATFDTITAGGEKYICNGNNTFYTEHSWNEANCFASKHCSVCGIAEGDALEHNYVNGVCKNCGISEEGQFYISNVNHLMAFAKYVNLGNKNANATLMADIDLSGYAWDIICETGLYYNGYGEDLGYAGTFDGNGHVIKNISVKSSATMDASCGLFGTVSGTIKNLGIEGFTFTDGGKDIRTGAIVGQLITTNGRVENCYVKNATITPGAHVTGGIAGCVYDGTIENCYVVESDINGTADRYGYIVGDSIGDGSSGRAGTVNNCYTDNDVIRSNNVGNVTNCATKSADDFASGEVTYLLNGSKSDGELVWYQTLTQDAYPQFDGSVVYYDAASGYNNHVHNWVYSISVDGTRISATCVADDCPLENGIGGSVTLAAPTELTYDGNAKEATYTNGLVTGDAINIVYASTTDELVEGKPVHAGDYTASITLGDRTATVSFTIDKATPTADDFVFTAPSDLVYNGMAKHATIVPKDSIVGMGDVTYIRYYEDGVVERNDASVVADYTVQIHTAEGDNYTSIDWLRNPDEWKFTISYLRTGDAAVASGEHGSNGWYVGEVTLTAPEGYEISAKKYLSGFGSTSLTFSDEQNETVTYYLKDANGYIAEKTVELKIDLTDPTAEYQIGTDGWKKFINTISFGLFCKDYKTVEIEYNDENSGVATKQYYIANAELSEDELKNIQWNDYIGTLNLDATGKYFIYIRVVDNAGREVVLNSEGIVVYADSEAVTKNVTVTYKENSNEDVEVKFNGNTVKEIKNGNDVVDSADYTVDTANGKITLKADYLDTLNAGTYTFTVSYNPQGVETNKVTLATTTFEVVVEKADISGVTAPTAITGLIYNGEPQALVSAGSAQGGEMQYSLDGVTYSNNVPTATGADEYTVYYKVDGDENHKDVAAQTITVKIAPKPITVTIENKTSVYGNDLATLTATDDGILSCDTNVYKLSTDANSSAIVGKYDIKGEAVDGNYNITFKNEDDAYEITKRELTLTVFVDDKPYDGLNTATINSVVINNVVGSDAVQVEYGTATFNSVSAADDVGISFTEFVLGGKDAGNYTLKQPVGVTANITNDWTPAEYTVNGDGWMNHDFVITANDGYKISLTNTADGEWSDTLTASVEGENSVKFYLKNAATGEISLEKTVTYKLDKNTEATGTTGQVYFDERNGWETFLNTISFGLFYKDEVTVKAEANDKLSGVERIEYVAFSEAKTLEDVKAIADSEWKAMPTDGVAVTVEDAKQFVYFVRIIDKAGNVTYLSTDGAEYDTTAPAISGVESGKTYYTTQKVTVTEKNIASITLNGEEASESITLEGNKDATYTIIVTDKAGNSTTVTVTMKPIATISEPIDDITDNDVTSDDKDTVQDVIDQVTELLEDDDLTDEEKAALEEIKEKADDLKETIEDAAKATETENTEKVKDVTAENVTPEDKTDLEKAKDDLEKALEDYGDNYTDDEKKAIEDEIKRIDDALEVIENVENVEELIGKIPENITKNDEATIKAADDAYNALTDYEKSLVDEDAKKTLDDAKAALAELNKPNDPNSPQTGDDSNLWLWFALLFVSGAGIFGITVYDRKRKAAGKR